MVGGGRGGCGRGRRQTRSNLAGTPRYMAPEAYRDERCTERVDVYSFAMLVWEMLAGRVPRRAAAAPRPPRRARLCRF